MEIISFDLDGTLIDSSHQIQKCLERSLRNTLKTTIPSDLVYLNLGQPISMILDKLQIDDDIKSEVISNFRSILEIEIQNGNKPFEGSLQLIYLLRNAGYGIAVATTKPTYLAKLVIKNSMFDNLIDFIQGTDEFLPKPNPEIFKKIEFSTGQRIEVHIGDRTEDMGAAKAYSVKSVGIAQSAHSMEMLSDMGADHVFPNFQSLLSSDKLASIFHKL